MSSDTFPQMPRKRGKGWLCALLPVVETFNIGHHHTNKYETLLIEHVYILQLSRLGNSKSKFLFVVILQTPESKQEKKGSYNL